MSDSERAHAHALISAQLNEALGPVEAAERATAIIEVLDAAASERPGAQYQPKDIVQLSSRLSAWPGCMLTIVAVGRDGVTGVVQTEFGRQTVLGVSFADIEHTGGIAACLPEVGQDHPFVWAA